MNSLIKKLMFIGVVLLSQSSFALSSKFTCHVGRNYFYPSQKIEVDQAAHQAKVYELDYNDRWVQSHSFINLKCEEVSNTQLICQDKQDKQGVQQSLRLVFDKFNVRTEQDPRLMSKLRFALKTDTLYVNYLEGMFELNGSLNLESAKCEIERF